MPSINHIHKYERGFLDKEKKEKIFQCRLENCSHWLRSMFILNKKSICWKCGNEFLIDKYSSQMRRPKCGCGTKREVIGKIANVSEDMNDLLKKLAGV